MKRNTISANVRKIRKSERLILASLSLSELKRLEKGDAAFLPQSVCTETVLTAIRYKIACMEQAPDDTHAWFTYWILAKQTGGQAIGLIGSKGLPDEDGYVELSYIVAKECRRKGYLTEALTEFLDWLFEEGCCTGAVLYIRKENLASRKAAKTCGFLRDGTYEGYLVYRYTF